MNANPSGFRTPPTGGWGRSIARRELANTTELPPNRLQKPGCAGGAGPVGVSATGLGSGTRHAMRACRRAPNPRRAAQGRNGEFFLPATSIISFHNHFPWRTCPLLRAWSVDSSLIEVSTSSRMSGHFDTSPRDQRPGPGILTRPCQSGRRVTPNWLSRCAASSRRRRKWIGPPEGKES